MSHSKKIVSGKRAAALSSSIPIRQYSGGRRNPTVTGERQQFPSILRASPAKSSSSSSFVLDRFGKKWSQPVAYSVDASSLLANSEPCYFGDRTRTSTPLARPVV